jgi:hypothetical protein
MAGQLWGQGLYEKYERMLTLPEGYVCYRVDGKIKVDGKLNEADWQKAQSTSSFVDISGEGFAKPCYDTSAKMLWDDNYLYVGAVLQEDDIKAKLSQRDTIIYYDNDFEVFLDPDGDGQNYFEIETNAKGVIFDLMLDKPYRSGGNFMIQWDCPGLQLAIHREGTLNKSKDKDKQWSVEMAIPHKALTVNFSNPDQAGNCWRINFSRVQWLKPGQREENWVWMPTGRIDMHMPDRWGFLYLSDRVVGKGTDPFKKNVYSRDAIEGIYVPGNPKSDVAKDAGASAVSGANTNISGGLDIGTQLVAGAANSVISATKSATSKNIRKIKVTIKTNYQILLMEDKKP